jgi:hypothetical protein
MLDIMPVALCRLFPLPTIDNTSDQGPCDKNESHMPPFSLTLHRVFPLPAFYDNAGSSTYVESISQDTANSQCQCLCFLLILTCQCSNTSRSASTSQIPKPKGQVRRIRRGGYTLKQVLSWEPKFYSEVQVCLILYVVGFTAHGLTEIHWRSLQRFPAAPATFLGTTIS